MRAHSETTTVTDDAAVPHGARAARSVPAPGTGPAPRHTRATEAVLLVGGKGTRLRPLTVHTPKPMVPAAGVPFLTHQLARARAAGIEHIVLATSYLAEVFEPHFGDGSALGLHLEYVTETEPLGTGGAIRNVAARLHSAPGDPVLVFNGDILTGLDIPALVATHRRTGADVSLHLTKVPDPRAFGLVPTDPDGRVTAFLEKPQTPEQIVTDQINAGAYVFTRSAIDAIPAGRPVSVERETFPGLLADGAHLQGMVDSTYWLDLGTPQAFVRGSADLVLGRAPSPAVPGRCGERLVLPGADVAEDAKLFGGTSVAAGAVVGPGARLDGSAVLAGAAVAEGAVIRNSLIGAGARIGARTVLDGVVVGDGAEVGADNELLDGVRVWCGARIEPGSIRFSSDAG
ncbi:NDP-sugar synthase [Streptomyces sp. V4-01]|uniref:NDP-sugar synthase n=1 Tax=Actinacidiphila polyblastidii TaxID=3110430 RepID=A0ABU7PEL4_9ACTN|nr:NDP-sugar synthase [Streptomyces sp. V4-01]